jgi:hypothetical protein
MNDLPLRPVADIGAVEDRFFSLRNFPLADGTVMPEATIAYETYGRRAPPYGPNGGRNAILCTHGYTGSHHFAGRNPANGNQPGSWDGLIGPGKAIDTDKSPHPGPRSIPTSNWPSCRRGSPAIPNSMAAAITARRRARRC